MQDFSSGFPLQHACAFASPTGHSCGRSPYGQVFIGMAESQELQEGVFDGVPAYSRPQSVNAPVAAHLHKGLSHDGVDDAVPGHICQAFLLTGASRLISHMPQEDLAHTKHRITVLFQMALQTFKPSQPAQQSRRPAFQTKLLQGLDDGEDRTAMVQGITP